MSKNLGGFKNIIKNVADKASVKLARVKPSVEKALPTVLIAGGCAGVGVAAWKACKATPEAKKAIQEFKERRDNLEVSEVPEEEKREQVLSLYKEYGFKLVKLYAKPVGIGALSVTMVFLGHGKLKKEITTLTATAASIDKMYQEYRGRVIEKYGEQEDFNLRTGAHEVEVREQTTDAKGKSKTVKKKELVADDICANSVYSRIFDETICGSKDSDYMYMFLDAQQKFANRRLAAQGYLFLNDVLDALGYCRCKEGQVVGWIYDPDKDPEHQIDFGIRDFSRETTRNLKNGFEHSIWLDFNVQGVIYDKLPVFADALMRR